NLGPQALADATNALVAAANRDPAFAGVFTLYNAGSPSLYADIDRLKAEKVGLTPTDVFSTLQLYLGSQYVNDFNYLGRTFEVLAHGITFEWTDLAHQQEQQGIPTLAIFAASAVFVFLVLAAQYESWKLPLAVVLIVPMCLLASATGLEFRGMPIDILAQIGFV